MHILTTVCYNNMVEWVAAGHSSNLTSQTSYIYTIRGCSIHRFYDENTHMFIHMTYLSDGLYIVWTYRVCICSYLCRHELQFYSNHWLHWIMKCMIYTGHVYIMLTRSCHACGLILLSTFVRTSDTSFYSTTSEPFSSYVSRILFCTVTCVQCI